MSDIFAKGGSAYVASKIDEAVKNESRTATISGNWEIESAVAIPSDFTLVNVNGMNSVCCKKAVFITHWFACGNNSE